MLSDIRFWLIAHGLLDPPGELELLRHMDKLAKLASDLERKIKRTKGVNERRYWEKKWEEVVVLHMEFEWHFHPERHKYDAACPLTQDRV